MYRFPIQLPEGRHLDLAQPFKAPVPVDFSQALSIQTTDHIGVDVTAGTGQQTWGLPCVWPFPFNGIVYDAEVDSPFGAKLHAHSQIDGLDPETGITYKLMYLHLSSVTQSKGDLETKLIIYKQGDVIGRIGNNGAVLPAPTPSQPFNGTHLHLGVGVQKPGDINATMVDPLLYFDLSNPFRSAAEGYKFNNTLVFGKHNPENKELQRVLRTNGFFPSTQSLTDYYGPITADAILKFRVAKGVPSITDTQGHSCGPLTRAELNKL